MVERKRKESMWRWNNHVIEVLAPEFNVDGRYLNGSQKLALKKVGLTPTKWTQIRETGPKIVSDLVAISKLINVSIAELVTVIRTNSIQNTPNEK